MALPVRPVLSVRAIHAVCSVTIILIGVSAVAVDVTLPVTDLTIAISTATAIRGSRGLFFLRSACVALAVVLAVFGASVAATVALVVTISITEETIPVAITLATSRIGGYGASPSGDCCISCTACTGCATYLDVSKCA